MGNRVLVAIDLNSIAFWAASYGVQLAARLEKDIAFILVRPPAAHGAQADSAPLSLERLHAEQRSWVDQVVLQCQREGVNLEIFFSKGAFVEEIIRFIRLQSSVQFVVMGVPRDSPRGYDRVFSTALKSLRRAFGGEILMVWEKGRVTRLFNFSSQNPAEEKET